MKILWFTWKDREHPLAGGAELLNEELAKRCVRDGHEVIFIVGGFQNGTAETIRDGLKIVRVGGRVSVYWKAYQYFKKHLQDWPDVVIDEVNTIPFFSSLYARKTKKHPRTLLFIHQLAREIWFYEMMFPLSLIGYMVEPMYLWILRKQNVITVSESTRRDLMKYGFQKERISIISEGSEIAPVEDLNTIQKTEQPTMLALGSIRAMKRTHHVVRAFEIAKQAMPELKLVIAGKAERRYGARVTKMMKDSIYAKDISYLGPVSKEKKVELMRTSHLICVASVKEGWGLIVTEAASQGTPAVVYDVDGLRDSVKDGVTGVVCKENTPNGMAEAVVGLLKDGGKRDSFARRGWEVSKEMGFERGYEEVKKTFRKII